MNEEKINEGIKIIAEFDGWEENCKPLHYKKNTNYGIFYSDVHELEYATSFDYLMPVIKKLGELKFDFSDLNFANYIARGCKMFDIQNELFKSYSAQAVFHLVVDAIEWYNSTKK